MPLHPRLVVPQLVEQHAEYFAHLHWYLQKVVQESYSVHSDVHPDRDVHGMVLCTTVRDRILCAGLADPLTADLSLKMKEGPARSVVLHDRGGTKIRVRKWPADRFSKERMRPVELAEQPPLNEVDLFGAAPEEVSYDLFVLWFPDAKAGLLDHVSLAGASAIDDAKRVQVYHPVPLPPPAARPAVQDPLAQRAPSTVVDDFDDELGVEDEGQGSA